MSATPIRRRWTGARCSPVRTRERDQRHKIRTERHPCWKRDPTCNPLSSGPILASRIPVVFLFPDLTGRTPRSLTASPRAEALPRLSASGWATITATPKNAVRTGLIFASRTGPIFASASARQSYSSINRYWAIGSPVSKWRCRGLDGYFQSFPSTHFHHRMNECIRVWRWPNIDRSDR